MPVGIMITNGGPHPPEKWAEHTASQIIDIDAGRLAGSPAGDARLEEASGFRRRLVALMTAHHAAVQQQEIRKLAEIGPARMLHELDASDMLDAPVAAIAAAAQGLSFEAHFRKPETQAYLRDLLAHHFRSAMLIERSWHADRNPDVPEAQAFRAARHPGA